MCWRKSSLCFVLFAATAAFAACSSEEEEKPQELDKQACKVIANRCHFYDVDGGPPIAHECHDTGHDGKAIEACNAMKAACLAACPERDAGQTGGSGGTRGGDAGPDSTGSGGTAAGDSGADAAPDASVDAAGTGGSGGTNGSGGVGGSAGYGSSAGTACEQLGSKCHGLGPGLTEECHEIGHNEDEPVCETRWAECIAACNHPG